MYCLGYSLQFLLYLLHFLDQWFINFSNSFFLLSDIHVKRRDTTSFFQRLAQATGGEVYRTRKEEINAVLNDIIEVRIEN